jgi:hypothetical protein
VPGTPGAPRSANIISIATLERTRALVRQPVTRLLAWTIGIVYAVVSMLTGGMLQILSPPVHMTPFWWILPSGTPWWDYPGLLVATPVFVLELPFVPTIIMVLTSAGVGLGMAVSVLLAFRLLRRPRSSAGGPMAVSTAAGLTPAMIALVTLGACCSTTAAATAGIGITAQASGTSLNDLLLNTWFLGVFQLAILWIALLAQEQLVRVYGFLFGFGGGSPSTLTSPPPPVDRRFVLGAFLRIGLLAGGATWSLAMLAEWTTTPVLGAGPWEWAQWVLQHQAVAILAVLAALFPVGLYRHFAPGSSGTGARTLRGVAIVGGISLLGWFPAPIASAGFFGLGNELLGYLGLSAAWGAVPPGSIGPLAFGLRAGFQFLLIGGFALAFGLSPRASMAPIMRTVHGPGPGSPANSIPLGRPELSDQVPRELPAAAREAPFSASAIPVDR